MQFLSFILLFLCFIQTPPNQIKVGDRLPSCVFFTAGETAIYTDSLKGNIVVIDVWASWNAPSRKHNLALVKLYEKYRQLNFRKNHKVIVLSISLDTERNLWMVAKSKDDLHWPYNICDYRGWESDAVSQLHLVKVPTNFIVNPAGTVVAKDIWGSRLDSTLKALNASVSN